jgi:limonene-1,2-epoxide hydrolase
MSFDPKDVEAKSESIGLREPLTVDRVRELWSKTYNSEGKPDWAHIFPYYHDDIIFQDSIQRIEGIEAFKALCERLASRCEQLQMHLSSIVQRENEIFFEWKMQMMFRRWPSAPIYGCSKLTLAEDGRIIQQRDYFDLWGDIFNEIPYLHRRYRRFMHRYFG